MLNNNLSFKHVVGKGYLFKPFSNDKKEEEETKKKVFFFLSTHECVYCMLMMTMCKDSMNNDIIDLFIS